MTERPLPDELISGQLDDRLAADEREQLESLLRDNPDARGLLQDLRQQSHDLNQLPGYHLGPGFGARLLADPRTQEAFDRIDSAKPIVADRSHRNIRTAVAAIASLAALILLAAFLQMPQLHEGSFELSRLDPSSPAPQEVDADLENEADLKESDSAANRMPFADSPSVARAEPENPKVLSSGREISEEDAQIADKDQVGQRRFAVGEPPVESGIPSPDAESATDELSVVADSVMPGSGVSPSAQSAQLGLSGTSESVDLPLAYLQVVEISYPQGPQMMEQFFAVLKRNDITLQPLSVASPEFEPVPTVPSTDPVAGGGGVGGTTRGWGGGAGGGDANAGDAGNSPATGQSIAGPPDSSPSGLFVVTTAPDKMAALVGELSSQAEITEYRLTRPTSNLNLDFRGNQGSAPSSRVVDQEGISGQVSGLADSTPRPTDSMFSFPAPDDSRDIGAATAAKQLARQRAAPSRELGVVQADAKRKSTARQGLALELQKKSEFGIDRSAAAVSESLVQRAGRDGLPANKVRLDLADRELQSLERYLARPNQSSEYRSFLLWIRTPERAQEEQQGDALPSIRNEPDDADQR